MNITTNSKDVEEYDVRQARAEDYLTRNEQQRDQKHYERTMAFREAIGLVIFTLILVFASGMVIQSLDEWGASPEEHTRDLE